MHARWLIFPALVAALAAVTPAVIRADDDEREEHRERSKRGEREHREEGRDGEGGRGSKTFTPPSDPTYTNVCSQCHDVYQPELLPARTWTNLLDHLDDHFTEQVEITSNELAVLVKYLPAHAADRSDARLSAKIMASIGNTTPKRITEIPYIKNKHREVTAAVIRRHSIGALSNCRACHQHAANGLFDEDDVKIPKN